MATSHFTRTFLALLILFVPLVTQSQDRFSGELSGTQIMGTFLLPGIMVEQRISERYTVFVNPQLLVLPDFNGSGLEYTSHITGGVRKYLKVLSSTRGGKPVDRNSGQYIAIAQRSIFGTNMAYRILGGAFWGIQRTYSGGFNWGVSPGVGIDISDELYLGPILDFQIGWVIHASNRNPATLE